jgi:hypothetical protein
MEQTELGLTGLVERSGSGATLTTRSLVTPLHPFAEGVTKYVTLPWRMPMTVTFPAIVDPVFPVGHGGVIFGVHEGGGEVHEKVVPGVEEVRGIE